MKSNKRKVKKDPSNQRSKKSKFQIVTMTAVWAMIIFMLLGVILPAVSTLFQQYF